MAIQYKNQPFDLTTDVMTTVLTLDESSRAIIQNIQAENTSTGTVTVKSAIFDYSATATTEASTIQMSTLTTQNLAKGPVVLEEQDALKIKGGTANVIKGLVSYALLTGDQGTA
jgi:hypothetical protein|tara:strand:+ start:109 stop:450 length:342 start_codon:yes stop_codon:yes gene_type:complete